MSMLLQTRSSGRRVRDEGAVLPQLREMASRAFSRAAGAPLIAGNDVRLLLDGQENYPRWLEAIRSAKDHVHLESYYVQEDEAGREFADALMVMAREGVRVRLLYDWLGGFRKASRGFWSALRQAGVEVRTFNPPRLLSPLGWLSRDHRKSLVVDGEVGFVTGLCISSEWVGDRARKVEPWRDTGVEIRGPAVAEIERAFARVWELTGDPLPGGAPAVVPAPAGEVSLRIVSSEPSTAGMMRLDLLVAALARKRLWLTDAYFAGTTSYVQALRSAAKDGVDVRLLVPGATDIPMLQPLSRSGYRTLLDAGVRVFEWNGTMVHAKTAVADGRWARIGSTNLNIASWFGNCELDAVIEDEPFAALMEATYEKDLANATEIVLDERRKVRAPGRPIRTQAHGTRGSGSTSRATAGAVRLGHAIGAAITDRRELGPVEARLATVAGLLLCGLSVLWAIFPRALAYPFAAIALWGGGALLWKGVQLRRSHQLPAPKDQKSLSPSTTGVEATSQEVKP